MLSKNKLFLIFTISFLLGIFINNLLGHFLLSGVLLLFLGVLFFNFYIYIQKYLLFLVFFLLGGLFGIGVSQYSLNNIEVNFEQINKFFYNKHSVTYEILEFSKESEFQKEYIAKLKNIDSHNIDGTIKAVLIIPYNFTLHTGDIIQTQTKIFPFQNSDDFFYKDYMLSKGLYFKSNIYDFKKTGYIEPNRITQKIQIIRSHLLKTIHKLYTKNEAIFLGGILLGARENLPQELKTNFNNSGLTHFIAVSGFNITILILFFTFFLRYFPSSIKIVSITLFVFLFTLFVGFTAPVIRASIMGLIGYYVLQSGRQGNTLSTIALTALIMILFSPLSLNYDVSLHLSFLAVLGIVYTQNFFKRIFGFLPTTLAIQEAFVLTMGALIFTLPIMIFNFGQVSIFAPLANIAVTWTIPIAMLLGFISILIYFLSPLLGYLFSYFTWIFLKFDMLMVDIFGTSQYSILKTDFGAYKYYFEFLYFTLLIFGILYYKSGQKKEQTY